MTDRTTANIREDLKFAIEGLSVKDLLKIKTSIIYDYCPPVEQCESCQHNNACEMCWKKYWRKCREEAEQ